MDEQVAPGLEEELEDQYIAVLLELYAVKEEMPVPSPTELSKVRYWKKVVSAYERELPSRLRKRVQYRARKAETLNLSPTEIALVRYAWKAFFLGEETPGDIQRRWSYYLADSGEEDPRVKKTVSYEVFALLHRFREICRNLEGAGLWPWETGV